MARTLSPRGSPDLMSQREPCLSQWVWSPCVVAVGVGLGVLLLVGVGELLALADGLGVALLDGVGEG
jgi:hypothetical protein